MEYCQRCIFLDEKLAVCNHPKLEGRAKDAHEKCQGAYKLTWMENKLLTEKGYTPYCGAQCSRMPRTFFNGSQFQCPDCGWKSSYSERFIKQYKEKCGIMPYSNEDICKVCGYDDCMGKDPRCPRIKNKD